MNRQVVGPITEVVAFLSLAPKIDQIAGRQHGHVTRAQLLALGMTSDEIQNRLAAGMLIAVHAGVYAVAYRRREPRALAHAAVLACGPRTVLSHGSAAALYGLHPWPKIPEVIATSKHRRPRIRVHRSTTLTRAQISNQYGIPVTSADRAIADIAARLSDAALIQIVGDARRAGRLGGEALHRLLASSARAARLIDPEQAPSESIFMAMFLLFLRRRRLPMPLTEQPFHGFRVDAIYPEQRLIIELHGFDYHRDRDRFERDQLLAAVALEHRHQLLPITWDRLTKQPDELARQLRAILAARTPAVTART